MQVYRGRGRTKSSARRDALQQALSDSVQLPDPSVIVSDMTRHQCHCLSTFTRTDFTVDLDAPLPSHAHHYAVSA